MFKDIRSIIDILTNRGYKYYLLDKECSENDKLCVIATNCKLINIKKLLGDTKFNVDNMTIEIVSYKDEEYKFKNLGIEFNFKYDINRFCKESGMKIISEDKYV